MLALEEQVAVITGAASGIGEAIARCFAQEGASLILCDINEQAGATVAAELGAHFIRVDVTREDDVAAAVDKATELHGRLDCMINNAGVVGPMESIASSSSEDWRRTVDVLLNSVFYGMKHAARVMIPRKEGCILSTASVSGVRALGPHAYVASKHAVVGLTQSAATELAASGIRVNAVAPGAVPTTLAVGMFGDMDAARDNAARRHPMQQVTEPMEIAQGFLYLAGRTGRNITGQILTIDGGLTACPEAARFRASGDLKFVGVPSQT